MVQSKTLQTNMEVLPILQKNKCNISPDDYVVVIEKAKQMQKKFCFMCPNESVNCSCLSKDILQQVINYLMSCRKNKQDFLSSDLCKSLQSLQKTMILKNTL